MSDKTTQAPRGRPRAFSEPDVLRRATRVFLAQGFEATAYEDIATATGLSKPSLYNAFGDKTALFEKVLVGYAAYARQQILTTFATGTSIAGATKAMLLAAADVYAPAEGPSTGCLLVGTALPACTQHDAMQKTLTDFLTAVDSDLESIIADRHASEAKRLHRSPRGLALQVSSLLLSLAVRARTGVTRRRLRVIATELGDTLKKG
jgi:AcrR family transcriptional regulator